MNTTNNTNGMNFTKEDIEKLFSLASEQINRDADEMRKQGKHNEYLDNEIYHLTKIKTKIQSQLIYGPEFGEISGNQ